MFEAVAARGLPPGPETGHLRLCSRHPIRRAVQARYDFSDENRTASFTIHVAVSILSCPSDKTTTGWSAWILTYQPFPLLGCDPVFKVISGWRRDRGLGALSI